MTKNKISGLVLCVATCAAPFMAAADDSPVFKTARQIAPKVRNEYCGANPFYKVRVLKNAGGDIGGYVLQPAIRDAPIPYLDHEGNFLTSFHIFGSDEEKRKAMAIVKPLAAQFSVAELLDCAAPQAAPDESKK